MTSPTVLIYGGPSTPAQLIRPTDPESKVSLGIAVGMNAILADVCVLYLKTRNFHWNMSGPHCRDYHVVFDDQADALRAMFDPIVERIENTGGSIHRSIRQLSRNRRVKDNDAEYVDLQDMLAELREDNQDLAMRLRDVHGMVDGQRDIVTASLIEAWIDEAERRSRSLYALCRNVD